MRFHLVTWRWPGVLALLLIVTCSILVLHVSTFSPATAASTSLALDDEEDEEDEEEEEDERADSIPHAVAGREDCTNCHRPDGGVKESPRNHEGFGNDICLTCHAPRGGTVASSRAEQIPHPVDGWANCGFCHQPEGGLKSSPRNHAGFGNDSCRACHGDGGTLEVGVLQQAQPLGPPMPHGVQGREDCMQCHQPSSGVRPAPGSHEGLARESCALCHQPGAPAAVSSPYPVISHAVEGRENCLSCHQAGGGIRPAPLDHAWMSSSGDCGNCHVSVIDGAPTVPVTVSPYPSIPHPVAGRENCLACHQAGAGLQPAPLDHAWMTSSGDCRNCHAPVSGQAPSAPATGSAPAVAATYPVIPHGVAGREDCLVCHQAGGGILPAPLDHDWIADSGDCLNCHQAQ